MSGKTKKIQNDVPSPSSPISSTSNESTVALSSTEPVSLPAPPIVSAPTSTTSTCSSCKALESTINILIAKVEKLESKLATYEEKVDDREFRASQNTQSVDFNGEAFEKWKSDIEELIESRTNRQLRKTLVFRNIPEEADEKTWADTDNLLSATISSQLDISENDAYEMIDRCHRGGNKKYYAKEGRARPIFAAMASWKDCERIRENFFGSSTNIMCDYKYGPRTSIRRNRALMHRKELKSKGTIDKAYIQFPARLMGKKIGEKEYTLIKDFSSMPVIFKTREVSNS